MIILIIANTQSNIKSELAIMDTNQVQRFVRAKDIASSNGTPERRYVTKTGKNKGDVTIKRAQPPRNGLLPITTKTLWTWVREGKFPQPSLRLGGTTAWDTLVVEAWINDQVKNSKTGGESA